MRLSRIIKIMIRCSVCVVVLLTTACSLVKFEYPADERDRSADSQFESPFNPQVNRTVVTQEQDLNSEAVVTLMRYSRLLGELKEQELNEEFEKIDAAYQQAHTDRGMLKLAVLLSLPASKFYDEKRASQLLKEYLRGSKTSQPALREYAHMLLRNLQQRSSFQTMYEELHQKLERERNERKQLQLKLEALKSIEKSITKRQNK